MRYAITRAGIQYGGIDTSHVSTTFADGARDSERAVCRCVARISLDEDGEASTLYEVLEGILQPLAIRIVQRAGKVYLYDLNGLYNDGTAKAIVWDGSSQEMGTDKVANNVVVSFSPYSSAELFSDELEYKGKYDIEHTNLTAMRLRLPGMAVLQLLPRLQR